MVCIRPQSCSLSDNFPRKILDKVQELEKDGKEVSRFSVTGYSLGGLVGRYVIGILHQRKFFEKVTPINFNTIATPHLGLVRYHSLISRITSSLGPKLLSRTGEQFYCADRWSRTGRPLIDVMADPGKLLPSTTPPFNHNYCFTVRSDIFPSPFPV